MCMRRVVSVVNGHEGNVLFFWALFNKSVLRVFKACCGRGPWKYSSSDSSSLNTVSLGPGLWLLRLNSRAVGTQLFLELMLPKYVAGFSSLRLLDGREPSSILLGLSPSVCTPSPSCTRWSLGVVLLIPNQSQEPGAVALNRQVRKEL